MLIAAENPSAQNVQYIVAVAVHALIGGVVSKHIVVAMGRPRKAGWLMVSDNMHV